jgi:hypothetical protein
MLATRRRHERIPPDLHLSEAGADHPHDGPAVALALAIADVVLQASDSENKAFVFVDAIALAAKGASKPAASRNRAAWSATASRDRGEEKGSSAHATFRVSLQ